MIRSYSARIDAIRGGGTVATLQPVSVPSIDADADATIKMSMRGTFLKPSGVNWLTDELQAVQVIDGTEYPVGIFVVGTYTENVDNNGLATINVEAYDRGLYLQQAKTESVVHLAAGTDYITAIAQMLFAGGISIFRAVETDKVLATDREDWPVGTPYITIVNTLLQEINYESVWFDEAGTAILRPIRTPSADDIDHQYGASDGMRVLQQEHEIETDAFSAPNVVVATCSNPDIGTPMISVATNNNALSSLSVFRRGRRIVQAVKVSNIPDQATLDKYAQRLCDAAMMTSEVVTISTSNVPYHRIHDTVAIIQDDLTGLYQEVGWHLALGPGEVMTHTLQRQVLI